jgi:hypothetical protein
MSSLKKNWTIFVYILGILVIATLLLTGCSLTPRQVESISEGVGGVVQAGATIAASPLEAYAPGAGLAKNIGLIAGGIATAATAWGLNLLRKKVRDSSPGFYIKTVREPTERPSRRAGRGATKEETTDA